MKRQKRSLNAPTAPAELQRALPAWIFPALLAALVLAFYWVPLTSASAGVQWDAADMHYPLQKYFSDHVRSGSLPFWTPYLFGGYPFLANPEVGAWYVPHWPFFLAGITPRAIQMELALQAFLACLGAYLLISRLVENRVAAMLGALAYGLSGFFAGHSSHVGLFSAAAGFPWLLLLYRRAQDFDAVRYATLGGIAGGLMILAGYVQTAMYGFLALGLYAIADVVREPRRWLRPTAIVASMLCGALGVAAIQILPGLELTSHSIRAAQNYSHNAESVLQTASLTTLVAPNSQGAITGPYTGPEDVTQHYFYAGILLLPLALVGAARTKLRIPALLMLVPAGWYMLGPAAGLYRLGALVPGLHKVRAPVQGWFVLSLALAMLAAAGLDWVLRRWPVRYLGLAILAVLFVDVWYWNSIDNPLAYAHSSFEELYREKEEVGRVHVAATQPPLTRFDMPRNLAVLGPLDHPLDLKLEATYGYFSVELNAYDEYAAAIPHNLKLLNGLNVSRRLNTSTGQMDLNQDALPRFFFPKTVTDATSLEESRRALDTLDPAATAYVMGKHESVRQDPSASASVVSHDEQSYRVQYHAASPSLMVFSMAWYPGWHFIVQGRDVPALRVDHALMGAVVPAGDGQVEFRFQPNYFIAGAIVTLSTASGLILLSVFRRRGPLPA
jgi:hypothetical protein